MCGDGQSRPHLQYLLTRLSQHLLVTGEECPVLARVTGPDRHCWRQSHCLSLLLHTLRWLPRPKLLLKHVRITRQSVCDIISSYSLSHRWSRTDQWWTQFHYTAWPDHGVPDNVMSVISFIRHIGKTLPRLPRTATAGPLQCRCRSHRHFHCSGYDDAADEDWGHSQCLPVC